MDRFADITLGINHQAWAVAHLLADQTVPWSQDKVLYRTETSTWYNGRECGLIFTLKDYLGPIKDACVHIAVFEYRSADCLCALKWIGESTMNPPNFDSAHDKAFPTEKGSVHHFTVDYGEIGKMAAWVRKQMEEFAEKRNQDKEIARYAKKGKHE